MAIKPAIRLLTVNEFYKMAQVGIIKPTEKVELINGTIVKMSPIKSKHTSCVKRINRLFNQLLTNVEIGIQDPISINKYSEPEPDISILKPSGNFYANHHPKPEDVILLIEVADSTYEYDTTIKYELYAKAGIPYYWVIDVNEKKVEVFHAPSGKEYKFEQIYTLGDTIHFEALQVVLKVQSFFE